MHFQIHVFISVMLTLPQQHGMTNRSKSSLSMSPWEQPLCLKQAAGAPFFEGQTAGVLTAGYITDMTSL